METDLIASQLQAHGWAPVGRSARREFCNAQVHPALLREVEGFWRLWIAPAELDDVILAKVIAQVEALSVAPLWVDLSHALGITADGLAALQAVAERVRKLSLSWCQLRSLKVLESLRKLRVVELSFAQLPPGALEVLSALPELRTLHASGLASLGASELSGLHEVHALDLGRTPLSADAWRTLTELHQLKVLRLPFCALPSWDVLLGMTALAELDLSRASLPKEKGPFSRLSALQRLLLGVSALELGSLPASLESLDVSGCAWVSGPMDALKALPRLSQLDMGGCANAGDSVAQTLALCGRLTELNLSGSGLGDAGLSLLGQLTRLKRLSILGCRVSEGVVTELRGALSSCRVEA